MPLTCSITRKESQGKGQKGLQEVEEKQEVFIKRGFGY
jgi:hypothetical protein